MPGLDVTEPRAGHRERGTDDRAGVTPIDAPERAQYVIASNPGISACGPRVPWPLARGVDDLRIAAEDVVGLDAQLPAASGGGSSSRTRRPVSRRRSRISYPSGCAMCRGARGLLAAVVGLEDVPDAADRSRHAPNPRRCEAGSPPTGCSILMTSRAPIGEHRRGRGTEHERADVDDPHAVQRLRHVSLQSGDPGLLNNLLLRGRIQAEVSARGPPRGRGEPGRHLVASWLGFCSGIRAAPERTGQPSPSRDTGTATISDTSPMSTRMLPLVGAGALRPGLPPFLNAKIVIPETFIPETFAASVR